MGFSADDRIGSYRVETELGSTGAGILIQARHQVLPRRAIIKVVHSAFADVQPYVLQTLREACILEAIGHPGVPIIYESGILPDRRPWFAFEAIEGPTLDELLAFGPMVVTEVAGLMRDLADVLEHAHRRGVVHCGLRPDRVVITTARRYPLCIPDWSEASAYDAVTHVPRAASEDWLSYLAPELVAQGRETCEVIDPRADMFALGVIAYRALTGELPFVLGQEAAPPIPISELRFEAPPALAALIHALLAFDRFDRPSACELRGAVDRLFETVPELRPGAARRRAPLPPFARSLRAEAEAAKEYNGRSPAVVGALPEDIILLEQRRLRRPRWTPDVHYLETPHVDIKTTEDDLAK